MYMIEPLNYEKSVELQKQLYPFGLAKKSSLFVLSQLTVTDLTDEEIIAILPEDKARISYVSSMMWHLQYDGLVDSELIPKKATNEKTFKWSINDYGRKVEKLARELGEIMKESRAYYREKKKKAIQISHSE